MIAHHLAPGLGQDRKVGILSGDLQQSRAAHALLPQRRALARLAFGQQQGARGVLAKARGKERRRRQLRRHERLYLFRIQDELVQRRWRFDLRQMKGDAIIGPQCAGVDAEPLLQPCLQRQRKRSVDPSAERSVQADAPVPHLVAESLHDQVAVVGHRSGCARLVVEVGKQVLDCEVVESGSVA